MGIRFIKIAVIYLVLGIALGMFMSMSHQFNLTGVHAHINLAGWVSMAVAGIIYYLFPAAGESTLGKIHFWLHNLGLPVMMLGVALISYGKTEFEGIIPIGAIALTLGILLFAVNIFKNVRGSLSQNQEGISITKESKGV